MAPPVCEAAAAAAAAAATATAAPAEVDDEPRLARAPPPPVADRGAVVVALPLPPPPLLKASFLAAWLFVDRDDATTTRPSLLGRGLVWDRPAPAVLFGLVLPDGVLLLSTVSVDDDTVALISEDEVGVTVGSALAAVSLSPIEDWTTEPADVSN